MKILLVDDDTTSNKLLYKILENYGIIKSVYSGNDAVSLVIMAYEKEDLFDVILLDIVLPDISGIDVLHKIRDYEKKKGIVGLKRSKVVMITGDSRFETVKRAVENQCDAYLIKPVNRENLEKLLRDLRVLKNL